MLCDRENREALRRVLATLVAVAGGGGLTSPKGQRVGEVETARPHPEAPASGEPRRTLPRHLHRAILRLLRPAEATTRRLFIVAARGMTPPPPAFQATSPAAQGRISGDGTGALTSPLWGSLRNVDLVVGAGWDGILGFGSAAAMRVVRLGLAGQMSLSARFML